MVKHFQSLIKKHRDQEVSVKATSELLTNHVRWEWISVSREDRLCTSLEKSSPTFLKQFYIFRKDWETRSPAQRESVHREVANKGFTGMK